MRSALIIASYDYQDPGLRRLRAPAQDAEALSRVLQDPAIGGFDVRTMLNEPAHVINEAVEEFFDDRTHEDVLLLHFSCHGIKDEDGDLYFAAANTKLRRLGATAVAADFVNRGMNRSRSRRIVLLLDCCYAGAFERGMTARAGTGVDIEEQLGGRGRAVITASSALEYAFEGDELADSAERRPSVFTRALVEGLETGEADRDLDGLVALDELYDYVYDKVRDATPNQTPGKWTFGVEGDLYVARRSRPVTRPAPLPTELQEVIDHPLAAIRLGAVQELARLLQARHAGLALAARLALERLAQDDSRTVAAAATAALSAESRRAAPEPVLPGARQDATLPEATVGQAAAAPTTPAATTSTDGAVAGRAAGPTPPATDHGQPAEPRQGTDPRFALAGRLAIAGAGLLVVGLFPGFQWDETLPTRGYEFSWYVRVLAAVTLGAAACTLLPRTRRLIGPGLLLGALAASTWGLLSLTGYWLAEGGEGFQSGFWLELVGHLVLLAAVCLAALALAQAPEVRLVPRVADGELPWLALLGVAGGLALFWHYNSLRQGGLEWPVAASVWATIMSLAVPASAALVTPRRFGVWLLRGWTAGAGALFAYYYLDLAWLRSDGYDLASGPIIVFGCTLLALLVVAAFFDRAAPVPRSALDDGDPRVGA